MSVTPSNLDQRAGRNFSCLAGPFGLPDLSRHIADQKQETELVTKRLFVGGLAWATDENALRDAFGRFGEVKDAAVITDAQTGKSRGFGFVTYNEEADAAQAIEQMDGAELDGRRIAVNIAQERQRSSPRPGGTGGGFRSGGFGGAPQGGGGGGSRPRAGGGGPREGGFGDGGRGKRGGKRGNRSRDDYDDY